MRKIKIGVRVATATRPECVFVVVGISKTRATLRSEAGELFAIAHKNIRWPMRDKIRMAMLRTAERLGLSVYEMQKEFEKVHGIHARRWIAAGGENPRPYVRKGYPKTRRRPGEGVGRKIRKAYAKGLH